MKKIINFLKDRFSLILIIIIFASAGLYTWNEHQVNTYFAYNDNHYNVWACGVYLKWDSVNKKTYPLIINDIDHKPLNVDSVWIQGSQIFVKLTDTFKYVTFGVANTDEQLIGITQLFFRGINEPALVPGGFKIGGSIGATLLRFNMTRTGCLCGYVRWSNGNFIQEAYTPRFATLTPTSNLLDVTFNSNLGCIDIKTHNVIEMTGIPNGYVQLDNGNMNYDIDVKIEYISKTHARMWMVSQERDYTIDTSNGNWKVIAGSRKKITSLPNNMTLNFDFGNADIPINIENTRFGDFANIFFNGAGFGKR